LSSPDHREIRCKTRDVTNAETLAATANTHCDRALGTTSLPERTTIAKPDAVLTGAFLEKGRWLDRRIGNCFGRVNGRRVPAKVLLQRHAMSP
jgi:hypothetical protein